MTIRCLITGGCGFIGGVLTRKVHKLGWQVDVVDDLSTGYLENCTGFPMRNLIPELLPHYQKYFEPERSTDTILMINGDFSSNEVLDRIRDKKYDYIFHVAALPRVAYSIEDPVFTTETNILKTVALFKSAAGNVKRIIFSSSSSVYGDAQDYPLNENTAMGPLSPYALQKATCESFARQFSEFYDLDIVCLRYFNVYGPGQMGDSPYSTVISAWCDALKNNKALRFDGDGDQSRDFTYVEDVVEANVASATATRKFNGDAVNIAFGKSHSLNDVLHMFNDKFGNISVLHTPARPGDVFRTLADTSKAHELFDFKAKISLEEGLQKTFAWWGLGGMDG